MEISTTVTASFDAGHAIPALEACTRPHGHHFTVAVTVTGELDPKTGWIRGSEALAVAVDLIATELHREDLNSMLPGVIPGPVPLAAYFLDRLAARFPRIVQVEVTQSDHPDVKGMVRRTLRQ
jgi:6-pyruvoyltetrahydropterin/6-carboxytetrahydropterin synthase